LFTLSATKGLDRAARHAAAAVCCFVAFFLPNLLRRSTPDYPVGYRGKFSCAQA